MVKKGRRLCVTTIDEQKICGRSLGVIKGFFGRKKAEDILRISKRGVEVAIPLRNIKSPKKLKNIRGIDKPF